MVLVVLSPHRIRHVDPRVHRIPVQVFHQHALALLLHLGHDVGRPVEPMRASVFDDGRLEHHAVEHLEQHAYGRDAKAAGRIDVVIGLHHAARRVRFGSRPRQHATRVRDGQPRNAAAQIEAGRIRPAQLFVHESESLRQPNHIRRVVRRLRARAHFGEERRFEGDLARRTQMRQQQFPDRAIRQRVRGRAPVEALPDLVAIRVLQDLRDPGRVQLEDLRHRSFGQVGRRQPAQITVP